MKTLKTVNFRSYLRKIIIQILTVQSFQIINNQF